MPTRFEHTAIDREASLSLGLDCESGQHYLSIPVSNRIVDYEEYYRLDAAEYDRFRADPAAARAFADACRRREHDDRLILKPGSDRGTPR